MNLAGVSSIKLRSVDGIVYYVTNGQKVTLYKWQYGINGAKDGWDIEFSSSSRDDTNKNRFVLSWPQWINRLSPHLIQTSQNCPGGEGPYDGTYAWDRFMRQYDVPFLSASGNAEVEGAPEYGSLEIWADHQRNLWKYYKEKLYDTGRGSCRGYHDSSDDNGGNRLEYGERYSCLYNAGTSNNSHHHFVFLGWNQGCIRPSTNAAKQAISDSIDFIHREFTSEWASAANVTWRYCIHHRTTSRLTVGPTNYHNMELSGITDACRQHGAMIVNGHHHLYARTHLLKSVGSTTDNPVVADVPNEADSATNSHQAIVEDHDVIEKGVTMSLTVGMGGYSGSCKNQNNGAHWMKKCIAKNDHRGAVIAEFDDDNPTKGTFRYRNWCNCG